MVKGFFSFLDSILKLAVLCGLIYVLVKWQFNDTDETGNRPYAEKSCIDEINSRFSTQSANVYTVTENDKGYVVRASVTFSGGKQAKVICLCNEYGRVEHVEIVER